MLSFHRIGFGKRLDTSADSRVLREEVLSAARETGCLQCVRQRVRECVTLCPGEFKHVGLHAS